MKRRPSASGAWIDEGIHICTARYQHLNDGRLPNPTCRLERSEAAMLRGPCIHVCAVGEKVLHHVHMTFEACSLQCGAASARRWRGVDIRAEFEEEVDGSLAPAFGGGLDWCPTLIAGDLGRIDVLRGAGIKKLADKTNIT